MQKLPRAEDVEDEDFKMPHLRYTRVTLWVVCTSGLGIHLRYGHYYALEHQRLFSHPTKFLGLVLGMLVFTAMSLLDASGRSHVLPAVPEAVEFTFMLITVF
jgi:hypothetical protein